MRGVSVGFVIFSFKWNVKIANYRPTALTRRHLVPQSLTITSELNFLLTLAILDSRVLSRLRSLNAFHILQAAPSFPQSVKPAVFFSRITHEEANRKIGIFVWWTFSCANAPRGVNDLIRDARARLRYEADLSFSREALEREVAAAPGNTLRLPIGGPHRTDIVAYVLGEVTFEPVTSSNSIVLRWHLIKVNSRLTRRGRGKSRSFLVNWITNNREFNTLYEDL